MQPVVCLLLILIHTKEAYIGKGGKQVYNNIYLSEVKAFLEAGLDLIFLFYKVLLSKKKLVTKPVPFLFRALVALKPIQPHSWYYSQWDTKHLLDSLICEIQGSLHSRLIILWNIQTLLSCSTMLKASVFWDESGKTTCGRKNTITIQSTVIAR